MRGVHSIESRSLALHAAVARRLLENPALWDRARRRVESWRSGNLRHAHFLSAWEGLLDAPVQQIADAIVDRGERGQRLRRASPFAFVLGAAERWAIWRAEMRPGASADAGLRL